MDKKSNNKIKLSAENKVLKFIAGSMTIIWLVLLFIPIYWMLTSSFSSIVPNSIEDISFFIKAPKSYTMTLEYTKAEAQQLGDDGIYLEANSLLWRTFNYKAANIGKTEVIVVIDGENEAAYSLSKANFSINEEFLWSKAVLQHKDIERVIEQIKESDWVIKETKNITLPEIQAEDEYTQVIYEEFSVDENLIGNVTSCYHQKTWSNLFDNYKIAWAYTSKLGLEGGLLKPIFNTVFIAAMSIILNVLLCAAAAYAISKLLPRKLKHKVMLLIMASGMVPAVATLIPRYQTINDLGMTNSAWGLILPGVASFGAVLLFKGTFDSHPREIEEAAEIDGAGELYKFFKIVLPSAKGVIGVQILTVFAGTWNDYFMPSLLINDQSKYTVALVMNYLMNVRSAPYNVSLALGFLISIPTLLIYLLFQKYLQYGIDYSGLKG